MNLGFLLSNNREYNMKKQNNISKKQLKDLLKVCDAYEQGYAMSYDTDSSDISNPYPKYSIKWYAFEYGFYQGNNDLG